MLLGHFHDLLIFAHFEGLKYERIEQFSEKKSSFYLPGSKNGYKNLKQSQVRRVKKDSLVLVHACITFEVLSSASLKLFISKNIFPRKTLDMDLKMHQFDTLPLRKVCANFLLLREKGDQIFLH